MTTTRSFFRTIILTAGLVLVALTMSAAAIDDFNSRLAQFEKASGNSMVTVANEMMKQLHDEEFTESLIKFTPSTPVNEVKKEVYYWSCEYLYDNAQYQKALYYGKKALPLTKGSDTEADCLNVLSLTCVRMSDYKQAATYALQCYRIDKKNGDPDAMSSSLNTLAGIYLGANQLDQAKSHILKAIEVAKKTDNPARMAVLQGMASEIFHAMKDDEQALTYINKACEIEKSLDNNDRLMVRYAQRASVLIGLKRYKEAEKDLSVVIPFLKKIGDEHSLAISYNKLGMVMRSTKRERQAVDYFRMAAATFSKMGDIANEMHSRRGLYECLWEINPDSAKIELDRFDLLKDSLYNNATAENLARYEAEFGNDELSTSNQRQKTIIKVVTVASVILAILIALGVWWYMNRRMKVREEALQAIIDNLKKKPEETVDKNEAETAQTQQESEVTQTPEVQKSVAKKTDDHDKQDKRHKLSESDNQFLAKIVGIVKDFSSNGEQITVEDIADKMFITRGHLNRRIKSLSGVTTIQYVQRIRLEQAKQLLADDSDLTIAEIAFKSGFEDPANFSRVFKRTFNVSPSQFRSKSA